MSTSGHANAHKSPHRQRSRSIRLLSVCPRDSTSYHASGIDDSHRFFNIFIYTVYRLNVISMNNATDSDLGKKKYN